MFPYSPPLKAVQSGAIVTIGADTYTFPDEAAATAFATAAARSAAAADW